jgi:hypothetical protein
MQNCTEVLKDADDALYAAKRGGRNMVRLAPIAATSSALAPSAA